MSVLMPHMWPHSETFVRAWSQLGKLQTMRRDGDYVGSGGQKTGLELRTSYENGGCCYTLRRVLSVLGDPAPPFSPLMRHFTCFTVATHPNGADN